MSNVAEVTEEMKEESPVILEDIQVCQLKNGQSFVYEGMDFVKQDEINSVADDGSFVEFEHDMLVKVEKKS